MDNITLTYVDYQILSEALTQYIDNDGEAQAYRLERGEPDPKEIVSAGKMLELINERILMCLSV